MSDDARLSLETIDPHGRPVRNGFPRRLLRWAGRHAVLVLIVVSLAALPGLGLEWNYLPNRPTLDAGKVQSVTICLGRYEPNSGFGPGYQQEVAKVTTEDPAVIQPLLDVFRTAIRGEQHNCGNSGVIEIRRTDGTVEELYILPGHDDRYYEYRMGSRMNRVDREPFLAALRAAGLNNVKRVPPS